MSARKPRTARARARAVDAQINNHSKYGPAKRRRGRRERPRSRTYHARRSHAGAASRRDVHVRSSNFTAFALDDVENGRVEHIMGRVKPPRRLRRGDGYCRGRAVGDPEQRRVVQTHTGATGSVRREEAEGYRCRPALSRERPLSRTYGSIQGQPRGRITRAHDSGEGRRNLRWMGSRIDHFRHGGLVVPSQLSRQASERPPRWLVYCSRTFICGRRRALVCSRRRTFTIQCSSGPFILLSCSQRRLPARALGLHELGVRETPSNERDGPSHRRDAF